MRIKQLAFIKYRVIKKEFINCNANVTLTKTILFIKL